MGERLPQTSRFRFTEEQKQKINDANIESYRTQAARDTIRALSIELQVDENRIKNFIDSKKWQKAHNGQKRNKIRGHIRGANAWCEFVKDRCQEVDGVKPCMKTLSQEFHRLKNEKKLGEYFERAKQNKEMVKDPEQLTDKERSNVVAKILKSVEKQVTKLSDYGMEAFFVGVSSITGDSITFGTKEGLAFLDDYSAARDIKADFLFSFQVGKVAAPQHNSEDNVLREQVQALFNKKYCEFTGQSKARVPYTALLCGETSVILQGLPKGVPFKRPTQYGANKLRQILQSEKYIKFIDLSKNSKEVKTIQCKSEDSSSDTMEAWANQTLDEYRQENEESFHNSSEASETTNLLEASQIKTEHFSSSDTEDFSDLLNLLETPQIKSEDYSSSDTEDASETPNLLEATHIKTENCSSSDTEDAWTSNYVDDISSQKAVSSNPTPATVTKVTPSIPIQPKKPTQTFLIIPPLQTEQQILMRNVAIRPKPTTTTDAAPILRKIIPIQVNSTSISTQNISAHTHSSKPAVFLQKDSNYGQKNGIQASTDMRYTHSSKPAVFVQKDSNYGRKDPVQLSPDVRYGDAKLRSGIQVHPLVRHRETNLREAVQAMFNKKYAEFTRWPGDRVPYTSLLSAASDITVEGMPDCLPFKRPAQYGVRKLEQILAHEHQIKFIRVQRKLQQISETKMKIEPHSDKSKDAQFAVQNPDGNSVETLNDFMDLKETAAESSLEPTASNTVESPVLIATSNKKAEVNQHNDGSKSRKKRKLDRNADNT